MVKKKFFAKALAFAMATGLLATAMPIGMTQVLAETTQETPDDPKVTPVSAEITYSDMTIVLTPGTDAEGNPDDYVFLEVMKKADDPDTKQGTVYPYPCSDGEVIVDLSFLKITKPAYLRVWGDKSKEKIKLTVSQQPTKIKYKYVPQPFPTLEVPASDADEAKIKEINEKNQKALIDYYSKSFSITDTSLSYGIYSLYGGTTIELQDEGTVVEGKTTYDGNWDFHDTSDQLANVKVTGTTLIIYQKAVENTYKLDSEGATTSEVDKAGSPAGAEVKVKIPAAPKAPKVTVDYAKGTIKLPKNAEYGIIQDGEIAWVSLKDGGSLAPKTILEAIADKLGIKDDDKAETDEAKTAKTTFVNTKLSSGFDLVVRTNDTKKKGTSNPAFITVKETVSYEDDKWGTISLRIKEEGKDDTLTTVATYEFKDTGVTVKFDSGSFEYKDGDKWKKITSGKEIKSKTELTIRKAGEKPQNKDEATAKLPSAELDITKPVDKSEITVEGANKATEVEVGKTLAVTATVTKDRDGNTPVGEAKSTTWESEDKTIATVGTDGTVTGVKEGKVKITATVTLPDDTKVVGTIEITVKPAT